MEQLIVEPEEVGQRLDSLLKRRFPDYSRTYFQRLIEKQLVLVNGEVAKKRLLLEAGDEIEVEFTFSEEVRLIAEDIPLDILYEDESLLVINKPAGMVVHPGAGHPRGTFANALIFHCAQLSPKGGRPGIVHRLDKDTSGVMVAAKNEQVQEKLVALFASREVRKEYLALCWGEPGKRTVKTRIGRHPTHRQQMAVVEGRGKEAVTHIETLKSDGRSSLVALFPETGRTHQLRVHLKHLGMPIVGDPIYGNKLLDKKFKIDRLMLHAHRLAFVHPISKKFVEFVAERPKEFI